MKYLKSVFLLILFSFLLFGDYSLTLSKKLDECINKKTRVYIGFKGNSNLTSELINLAFSIAGKDDLKFSNSTLKKIQEAIIDSKDVVTDMVVNGKADSTNLGIWITTVVLKNANPKERQEWIERVFEDNIPNHTQTGADTFGSLAGGSILLATKAFSDGLVSNAFPAFTALVKTEIAVINKGKEFLSNDAFDTLYKAYKESNGRWEDIENSVTLTGEYRFLEDKVRDILINKGKSATNKEVTKYIKNMLASTYAQEKFASKEKKFLLNAKEHYLRQMPNLDRVLGDNPSDCDRFFKYVEYITKIKANLSQTLKSNRCDFVDKNIIEKEAYLLSKYWFRDNLSFAQKRALYQKEKNRFLKSANCNKKDKKVKTPKSGYWRLINTIITSEKSSHNGCGGGYGKISSGSFSRYLYSTGKCGVIGKDSVQFNGSWNPPPSILIPKRAYDIHFHITASNKCIYHWDDYLNINLDMFYIKCGFATAMAQRVKHLSVYPLKGNLEGSWSGKFIAPDSSYGALDKKDKKIKFEITISSRMGCVRYIYEYVN